MMLFFFLRVPFFPTTLPDPTLITHELELKGTWNPSTQCNIYLGLYPCNKGASFLKQLGCVNATNLGSSELQFSCLSWCWKRRESWHSQCIHVLSFPSMFSLHIIPLFCQGKFSFFPNSNYYATWQMPWLSRINHFIIFILYLSSTKGSGSVL